MSEPHVNPYQSPQATSEDVTPGYMALLYAAMLVVREGIACLGISSAVCLAAVAELASFAIPQGRWKCMAYAVIALSFGLFTTNRWLRYVVAFWFVAGSIWTALGFHGWVH